MNASRTRMERMIPYHLGVLKFDGKAALKIQIVELLQRRKNAPSTRDVFKYFYGTDAAFIDAALTEMVIEDRVRCFSKTGGRRGHNSALYWELV